MGRGEEGAGDAPVDAPGLAVGVGEGVNIGGLGLVGGVPGQGVGVGVGVDVLIGFETDELGGCPAGRAVEGDDGAAGPDPGLQGVEGGAGDGRAEPAAGEHEHVDVFPVDRAEAVDADGGVVGGRDMVEHVPGVAEAQ